MTETKDRFKAEIREGDEGETRLSVTHDGHQWSSLNLNHREMVIVKELLSKELDTFTKNLMIKIHGID